MIWQDVGGIPIVVEEEYTLDEIIHAIRESDIVIEGAEGWRAPGSRLEVTQINGYPPVAVKRLADGGSYRVI